MASSAMPARRRSGLALLVERAVIAATPAIIHPSARQPACRLAGQQLWHSEHVPLATIGLSGPASRHCDVAAGRESMLSDCIENPILPDSTPPSVPHFAPSSTQRKALGICAVAAVAALAWLSLPVASGLFLGTFLAFSLLDVYEGLQRRWRRPSL